MKLASVFLLSSCCACRAFIPSRVSPVTRPAIIDVTRLHALNNHNNPRKHPSSSALRLFDDLGVPETALRRMRRRKVAIYTKKKYYATGYLFALWYVFSVAYNIISKQALNLAPSLAWTTATLQMSLGLTYALTLWKSGAREQPKLSVSDLTRLLPVAILHSLVHIGGVVSMGAGAVSFTYIVKASEPAVSAILAAFGGTILPATVYLSLLPVMGGVAIASVSELTFTWKSFNYAMLSNLASAGRGIVGKKAIDKRLGQSMTASNLYAVLTMMATCFLIPLALLMEGSVMGTSFRALRASNQLGLYFGQNFLASMFYYLYNEVAFLCLDNVSPVSHALGNTLKRVFIIISSMVVFGNRMTLRGAFGSVLAVGGVFLYSMEKTRHSKKKASHTRGKAS
jgi:solute carrier family 35 protein E1